MNMKDVITENKKRGHHFFSGETMSFFNSEVETELINGQYFVTSERRDKSNDKKYTIRKVRNKGKDIDTVGDFEKYNTLQEAKENIPEGE